MEFLVKRKCQPGDVPLVRRRFYIIASFAAALELPYWHVSQSSFRLDKKRGREERCARLACQAI